MIIIAVIILSVSKDILLGKELTVEYLLYLLAGVVEMILFDSLIYHGFFK